MDLYEFNQLDENSKAQLIWDDAVFLTNIIKDNKGFNLYRLNTFYVEVELDNQTNKISSLRAFKSIEPLAPYLDEIDLTQLG